MDKELPLIDARLLASFVTVAELRHFGKAAEALHATQPGVSQHIAKLEIVLGVKLIERTRRGVELTPAGAVALRHAHVVLSHLRKMRADSVRVADGLSGTLRLGLSSSVIFTDIPARIAAYRAAHPDVALTLEVHSGEKLRSLMDYGHIDAAITTLPLPEPDFIVRFVTWQAMGVALRASHPLAKRRQLSIADLRDEPFIVVPREQHPANHDALVARFHEMKAPLRVAAYDAAFQNVLARVAIGEGVGMVAMAYATDRPTEVRVVKLEDPDLSRTRVYALARADMATPLVSRFLDALPGKYD